jgi:hypothetical protein
MMMMPRKRILQTWRAGQLACVEVETRAGVEHRINRPPNAGNVNDETFDASCALFKIAESLKFENERLKRELEVFQSIRHLVRHGTAATSLSGVLDALQSEYKLTISHDYRDLNQRRFVCSGPRSSTRLGGFPHAMLKINNTNSTSTSTSTNSNDDGNEVNVVSISNGIVISAQILSLLRNNDDHHHHRSYDNRKTSALTSADLIAKFRGVAPASDDNNAPTAPNEPITFQVTLHAIEESDTGPPVVGECITPESFNPPIQSLFSKGFSNTAVFKGNTISFKFKLNADICKGKSRLSRLRTQRYCFRVAATSALLKGRDFLIANSDPFLIRHKLGNFVRKTERYVVNLNGDISACAPRFAPNIRRFTSSSSSNKHQTQSK